MRKGNRQPLIAAGISLVETIVSVGVLAVVIPLALGAMLQASNTGSSARAETRAPAIAEYCMIELRAARKGTSNFFPAIEPGQNFGDNAKFMGLAFGRDGAVIGRITSADFENGIDELEGERVYFLARATGALDTETREVDLVTVEVEVEYPGNRKEEDRSRVTFHTKLP